MEALIHPVAPVQALSPDAGIRERELFTGAVSKALGGLKRFCHVASIRQNYKGTGTQRARRQLWLRLADGRATDVWLDSGHFAIGGVCSLRIPGTFAYGDHTPAQVANQIAQLVGQL